MQVSKAPGMSRKPLKSSKEPACYPIEPVLQPEKLSWVESCQPAILTDFTYSYMFTG